MSESSSEVLAEEEADWERGLVGRRCWVLGACCGGGRGGRGGSESEGEEEEEASREMASERRLRLRGGGAMCWVGMGFRWML